MSFVNIYPFVCVCAAFPFGLEGGVLELIVYISSRPLPFFLFYMLSIHVFYIFVNERIGLLFPFF